jgi:hypothetical protein
LPPLAGLLGFGRKLSLCHTAEIMIACWELEHAKPMVH